MKILMPVGIALLGLGVGVGAGVALKPAPPETESGAHAAAAECAEGHGECPLPPSATEAAAAAPMAEAHETHDPFAPVAAPKPKPEGETASVPLDKPFVVPVFKDESVAAMIVSSVAIEIAAEGAAKMEAVQPRLRDSFLAVMFRHANSGGFDGTFTEGRKMDDLRSALLIAAQEVFEEAHVAVYEVLITDIARQDM